ncbi:hypothetical protein tinsulaeT_36480 [Thalassotalea insulae]|uniref:histidine kinase n=1 Tax=Thalassotalea insulae TaxID=2056778 RepID=A0ABQ6GWM0_9GAMM|nr:ATP-binding protein [Thalassotalea insulae]GLX80308.1 hypothetical protein tinsulaeT_36480 [Thalassotalea insulae]
MKLHRIFNSNQSIRHQAIIFLITSISVMTLIISILTAAGVNQQSRQLMLKNAFQITDGLAKQAVFALLSGANQNAKEAIQQVQGFQSVLATRLRYENQDIFISEGEYPHALDTLEIQVTDTQILKETADFWLIKTPVILTTGVSNNDESEFELESKLTEPQQIIGYAEVIYSKASLSQSQQRVAIIITSIAVISVLVLVTILNFALAKLFAPLEQLAQTMRQAKASKDHLYANVTGAKEIRKMAGYYNSMMKVLEQQESELISHRDQLEHEVKIRTKELEEARDTALIASQHKSEFMANMSHELRTPIQSIIGYGELVTEELELNGDFELIEDMDKIANNSQRLLFMINSLLDLAKIEAGKLEISATEILISELQATIQETIKPLAQKNNNQFEITNSCQLNKIILDKEKLEQVLLNLLSNACKFTNKGKVSLNIHCDKQHIYFDVADTGIGLSPEQQEYIFDEFRQVDSGQARKFSGTGLGLSISKRFVELMQGQLTVSSTLGQGAVFTITLPISS